MSRKPSSKSTASSLPKGELFAAGEVESVVPEPSAAQRAAAAATKPAPKKAKAAPETEAYRHSEAKTPLRPEVGTQDRFRHKKAPTEYRYDPSLSPVLEFDGQNPGREAAGALLARIQKAIALDEARAAATALTRLSRPFLNWTGKAERLSFSVPTLPPFIHERLSTKAILETLRGHRRSGEEQLSLVEILFGDPLLTAYARSDAWVK